MVRELIRQAAGEEEEQIFGVRLVLSLALLLLGFIRSALSLCNFTCVSGHLPFSPALLCLHTR